MTVSYSEQMVTTTKNVKMETLTTIHVSLTSISLTQTRIQVKFLEQMHKVSKTLKQVRLQTPTVTVSQRTLGQLLKVILNGLTQIHHLTMTVKHTTQLSMSTPTVQVMVLKVTLYPQ